MRALLIRLLRRLSVGRKLLLIFLLDMTAVAFISGILVNEKYIAIDFARKELAGNDYIAQVRPALLAAANARAGATKPLAAQAEPVAAAESRHGDAMASAEASAAFVQALRNAPPAEALARGRALVTRVGNLSNLILDPDLDSYYTMSIVVLRAPELLEALSDITASLARGDAASPDPTYFLLLEGRLDAARAGLFSDYAEAAAAGSPALGAALSGSRQALLEALDRHRVAARAALAATRDPGARGALREAHGLLLVALDTAWADAQRELDRLLHARIDGFFSRMWLHLGTALGLLALILTAVYAVAQQIALPLRRLSAVTDEVRRTGDHRLRAQWDSQDEIGRLVLGFNDMLAQLDRERAVQQELAASARAAEAQLQIVEAIPIPLMVTAVPGHQVLHANRPARAWLGDRQTDPWCVGLEPAVRARFFQELADRDELDEFEVRWRAGPEPSWAVLSARRLDFHGQPAVLTAFTPINHLKQMERRLALWSKVFETSGEGIVIVDAGHRILTVNHAFCRGTLYELHEVIGEPLARLEAAAPDDPPLAGVLALAEQRGSWQGEVRLRRRDGTSFPAWTMVSVVRDGPRGGEVSHYIATAIDISDRKRNEERIRFLAQHDVLTELPNRALCTERLRLAMQQARRSGDKVGVLFVDLDRFKNINDSLGHHVGDALLRSVARRIVESVRAGDTVSRLGGDEFVVVLNGVASAEEIGAIVDHRLVPLIRRPHDIDGAELNVSCSVGIAIFPDDADDLDSLMRHADAAMYQAKAEGRDTAQFFTPELNERVQRRLQVESRLRRALERREFALHYQPRVDAASGRLLGAEALLRWHPAELEAMPPERFIPVAEETGLIVPIGAWVIDEACRQLARWRAEGLGLPQVSINVSALQWRDGGLVEALRGALERHGLAPGAIEIELTESTLMASVEQTLAQMQAIRALGVEFAIDDFGTGYSSLNYLNRFPIDRLKIDRSFVRDMLHDPTDLAITRAIIGLGHTLGLKVVAEGVETEAEAQLLRAARCDELQGFLVAQPMPPEALAAWVGEREAVGA